MNQGFPWIATFVQETLSEYLDRIDQHNIEVKNDGANLSFANPKRSFVAHVQEWGVDPSGDGVAVLQDVEHQVDAIIPEELLSLNNIDFSSNQPKGSNPKHHSVRLLDFKLVCAYTKNPAQIHLLITKFQINWEDGKTKNFQLKKKLNRNPKVKSLLEATRQQAQGISKAVKSGKSRSHIVGRVESTQTEIENEPLLGGNESQQISSQIPRDHRLPKQISQISPSYSREPNELLRHLGSSSPRIRSNKSLQKVEKFPTGRNDRNSSAEAPVNDIGSVDDERHLTMASSKTEKSRTRSSKAGSMVKDAPGEISDDEGSISSQPKNGADRLSKNPNPSAYSTPNKTTLAGLDTQREEQSPSKKRTREGRRTPSQSNSNRDENIDPGTGIPPKKRQRTSPTPEISSQVSQSKTAVQIGTEPSVAQDAVTDLSTPARSRIVATQHSPWENLKGLNERDVAVPMDQQELLDDNKLCWVSPRSNCSSPQGHIPSLLLKKWNTIAQKRKRNTSTPETSPERLNSGKAAQKGMDMSMDQEAVTISSTPVRSYKAVPAGPSPWEGFDDIKERDIIIPKDQRELLDDNKLCWIPPNPTDPRPQGHVPPSLLKAWNDSVNRRHHQTELPNVTPERSISPTQERDGSSTTSRTTEEYSDWEVSPERSPAPARGPFLPPSSPVKQPTLAKRRSNPTPVDGNHSGRSVSTKHTTDAKLNGKGPSSGPRSNRGSPETAGSLMRESPKPPRPVPNHNQPKRQSISSRRSSPLNEPQNQDHLSRISSTPSPNQELARKCPSQATSLQSSAVAQEDDSDEESVMDTSVPIALGENIPEPTQSSQVEEEMTSSGQSLPGPNGECIQVAVSPLVGNNRFHCGMSDTNINELGHTTANHSSSQSHKTSSQSRVLNTYPSHESHNEAQSSHETSNPGDQTQEMQVQVNVPVTQLEPSSMASQWQSRSQDVINTSQSDIVLDSSGPVQRHKDMFSPVNQPPVFELTSPRDSAQSEPHNTTQESTDGTRPPNNHMSSPVVSPLQPVNTPGIKQKQALSKALTLPVGEDRGKYDPYFNTQSAHLLARREGFISKNKNQAEAREVYQQFCSCYCSYSGDFDHFTKMCKKLSDLRQQGKLQRSYLWDDFIIMHLHTYPSYCENAFSQNSKKLNYEDYFLDIYSRPSFKKRSLTLRGIELVASQFIEIEPPRPTRNISPIPVSSPLHGLALGVSFTSSLVDKFTNLQTHSFNVLSPNGPPAAKPEIERSSRASSVQIKLEGNEPVFPEPMDIQPSPVNAYNERPVSPTGEPNNEPTGQIDEPGTPTKMEAEVTEDDTDMEEIPETDPEDSDQHDDTLHETASVELGDESFDSAARGQSPTACDPMEVISGEANGKEDSEPESDNENWFISLRHMRPKRGVWSDGPTEFKRWAEADQNVHSQRSRRGGSRVLLDDNGVIRRPIYR
ncbi:hypothetical protein N7478_010391 [Penicillium angulare]|uniref:uncharacterized protein n=1 Tax=Penicillium angulare TaxID=116970 RepID=UPI002541DEA7|nr:uncharacterized protein N7478_010391 [Penicillium angulare]KAJ5267583.1 hypothetical protein N7478_010391 [Penicillium angulare]